MFIHQMSVEIIPSIHMIYVQRNALDRVQEMQNVLQSDLYHGILAYNNDSLAHRSGDWLEYGS